LDYTPLGSGGNCLWFEVRFDFLLTNVRLKRTIKLYDNERNEMGTKTISASKLRNNLADALDSVSDDEVLIVTRRGKKDHAIIDLDKLEDIMAVSDPEYVKSIAEAREQIKKGEVYTFEEVFGNL